MAKLVNITVKGYRCERCRHEWVPRREDVPRVCPRCKSPYWETKSRRASQTSN